MTPTIPAALLHAVLASIHLNAARVDSCYETMAAIVQQPDGTYAQAYSEPTYRSKLHVEIVIEVPKGDRIAAIWHTHPACPGYKTDTQFSPDDVATQRALNVPSFIYVQIDRSIRMRYKSHSTIIQYGFQP